MSKIMKIENQWIDDLFDNENFTKRLKSFIKEQKSQADQNEGLTGSYEIEQISQEISSVLSEQLLNEINQRRQLVSEQISKMNNEISILKNYLFGCSEKQDLETTCYNKSKLQISSILEQETSSDFAELKNSLVEMQQRFDFWFGKTSSENQSYLQQNSQLSIEFTKRCNQTVSNLESKIKSNFQTTDLMFQRRIQQISKTLNNVLQMINQNPRKNQTKNYSENTTSKQTGNAHSLLRQSSLQNLKIKNFFSFGQR